MLAPLPPVTSADHQRGDVDAPLTVVQYGDYDCPHTRAATAVVHRLERSLGLPMRYVFRHYPQRELHGHAQRLAEVAEAAAALGQFWPVHERLMGHREIQSLTELLADLEAAHVDIDALQPLLGTPRVVARIEHDRTGGHDAGVRSTPSWFFNGVLWSGSYDEATLRHQAELLHLMPSSLPR